MKKEKKESTQVTEKELLELLKRVLPKATHDPKLAGRIYEAVEFELKAKSKSKAFDKFCTKMELPDLEPKSVEEVRKQFAAAFGDGEVVIKPNKKEKSLAIEVTLPEGTQFQGEVKVNPNAGMTEDGEQEITLKFVPFPVSLPGDAELVWMLAKRENMTPEEAAVALTKVEDDFWASKTGQKLIRDRVERSFPEFVSRVPAGMLNELGLKRHYKTPEPVKQLRVLAPMATVTRRATTLSVD